MSPGPNNLRRRRPDCQCTLGHLRHASENPAAIAAPRDDFDHDPQEDQKDLVFFDSRCIVAQEMRSLFLRFIVALGQPVRPAWNPRYAAHEVRIESWSKFISEVYWNVELEK